ncbi:HNH endonuclease signature motif containing protein [Pseudonocardia oceani]|nr:HNH endonuclease signature motif containing protein [Pseudonocardia oceani]
MPLDRFGRDKNRRDGLNPWCKACNAANARRHGQANREAISAKRKAQYAADPEPARKRVRQYTKRNAQMVRANKRRYYQENRGRHAAYMADYYRRDPRRCLDIIARAKAKKPEYYRLVSAASTTVRRARFRKVQQVPFTAAQLAQRLAYYGNRCWMCGAPAGTVDHVKPIVAGGPNMLANLRPACPPCNSGKAGRWPFQPKASPHT